MRRIILSFILFLFFITCTLLHAGSSGKISGRVTDETTGEGLPFANVFIDGTSIGAASDIDGYYTLLNVPPGLHNVTASIVGYQKKTTTEVRVNVDFTTNLDFQLNSGSIEMDAVIVQGERNPLIRQDLTNPVTAITAESIQELPVDQISDVIKLQAGITTGDDGSIHIRGGYANETAYTLNGVSLNDPYGNNRSVGLATNAVQEVSVSSGTFSAQYGNALSGVVNYVTKEGKDKFTFSLRGYAGDYFTDRDVLFPNIDDIDPLNRGRFEGTFGGPIPGLNNKVKFFFSGVYENFKGSLYGKRLYNTTDAYLSREAFDSQDERNGNSSDPYWFNPYSENSTGEPTGNGEYVAMNPSESFNLQGNILYNISPTFKLKYETVFDKTESKGYNRAWKFNPDGLGTNFGEGLIQTLSLTHTVSDNMFYTLKSSYGYNLRKYYLYEDITDERYLPSVYTLGVGNSGFVAGGTSNYRLNRRTSTFTIKGDLVAQLFKNHEVKFGFETRFHNLAFEDYNIKIRDASGNNINNEDLLYDSTLTIVRSKPFEPSLLNKYKRFPFDGAIYIQDKIELAKTLILNVGLRYEYFDPAASFNPNLSADLKDLQQGFITRSLKKAEVKQHLSPRISVSYPITDKGVIRFSYGHFYQNGSLGTLYSNPQFFVDNVGQTPTFGNPDVNMQRSIQYEVGLQQQLAENLKMEITGYYKDVRDYIFTQSVFTSSGREYNALTNLAYANVRGLTFRLERRRTPNDLFYASLDYTFQIAEGNRTEPSEDLFFSEEAGKISETYLVALSFDRPHVANLSFGLFKQNDWTIGAIAFVRGGTPYTPAFPSDIVAVTFEQRSASKPIQWNLDLKLEKFFTIEPFDFSVFLQVENLFDNQNDLTVYSSTGEALKTIDPSVNPNQFNQLEQRIERGDPGLFSQDELDNFYNWRPERINRPREIRLGFSLLFN
jgi:outer membrane receptor protein involved in Fe transport